MLTYTYRGAGSPVRSERPALSGGLVWELAGDHGDGLDALGRIEDLRWRSDAGTDLDRIDYVYDAGSRKTAATNAVTSVAEAFAYDGLGRLVRETRTHTLH